RVQGQPGRIRRRPARDRARLALDARERHLCEAHAGRRRAVRLICATSPAAPFTAIAFECGTALVVTSVQLRAVQYCTAASTNLLKLGHNFITDRYWRIARWASPEPPGFSCLGQRRCSGRCQIGTLSAFAHCPVPNNGLVPRKKRGARDGTKTR